MSARQDHNQPTAPTPEEWEAAARYAEEHAAELNRPAPGLIGRGVSAGELFEGAAELAPHAPVHNEAFLGPEYASYLDEIDRALHQAPARAPLKPGWHGILSNSGDFECPVCGKTGLPLGDGYCPCGINLFPSHCYEPAALHNPLNR